MNFIHHGWISNHHQALEFHNIVSCSSLNCHHFFTSRRCLKIEVLATPSSFTRRWWSIVDIIGTRWSTRQVKSLHRSSSWKLRLVTCAADLHKTCKKSYRRWLSPQVLGLFSSPAKVFQLVEQHQSFDSLLRLLPLCPSGAHQTQSGLIRSYRTWHELWYPCHFGRIKQDATTIFCKSTIFITFNIL